MLQSKLNIISHLEKRICVGRIKLHAFIKKLFSNVPLTRQTDSFVVLKEGKFFFSFFPVAEIPVAIFGICSVSNPCYEVKCFYGLLKVIFRYMASFAFLHFKDAAKNSVKRRFVHIFHIFYCISYMICLICYL